MTGTTHALVGAALGVFLERPWAAFAAGVGSHAALDLLPHYDYAGRSAMLLLDGICVSGVLVAAIWTGRYDAMLGALGGIAPDLEHALAGGNPHGRKPRFVSHQVEHGARTPARGIIAEVVVAIGAFLFLHLCHLRYLRRQTVS